MKTYRQIRWAAVAVTAASLLLPGCRKAADAVIPAPRTETRTFKRDLPGCGDKTKREEPCLTFSASWVELRSGASPEVLARINKAIEEQMHPVAGAPAALEQEAAGQIAAFQKLKGEYPEMPQTWFDRRNVDVLLNDGKLFSVAIERKHYNGGPHAEESTRLFTFQLSDGQPVQLGLILTPEEQARFNRLADKRLRQDRGIEPGASLEEFAIMPGEMGYLQCKDIAAMPKGLRLHFDSGTIAFNAVGAIDITLSWEEVAPALRANGPLAHLAGR